METKADRSAQQSIGLKLKSKTFIILFILSFSFDFKGAVGGSPLQFCMAGINILAFVVIATIHRYRLPVRGEIAYIFWGWLSFLVVGSLGAFLNEVPNGQYIRTIYPFILFIEGVLVAWWATTSSKNNTMILIKYMTWAAIISFFMTLFWGFYFNSQGINSIRYQILSPLIPFLISVAGYDLFFARQHQTKASITLIGIFIVISLSVTRGELLMIFIVTIIIFTGCVWNIIRGYTKIPKPLLRALICSFVIVLSALFLSVVFYPDIFIRWISRSLGEHNAVTFWTRVAAVSGQWNQIIKHPSSWFVGRGFGHLYLWSQSIASLSCPAISTKALLTPKWYPGEFMWITPIFYSGFLTGIIAIGIFLYSMLSAYETLVVLLRKHTWLSSDFRPIWIAMLSFFFFLASSFTANPFIVRLSALFMGLSLGLLMGLKKKLVIYPRKR